MEPSSKINRHIEASYAFALARHTNTSHRAPRIMNELLRHERTTCIQVIEAPSVPVSIKTDRPTRHKVITEPKYCPATRAGALTCTAAAASRPTYAPGTEGTQPDLIEGKAILNLCLTLPKEPREPRTHGGDGRKTLTWSASKVGLRQVTAAC